MALPHPRLARLLTAPAPVALVLASTVAVPAAAYVAVRRPPPAVHSIRVGLSSYPATATAFWRDQQGVRHALDPWAEQPVRVAARQVVVAAAAGGPLQCVLTVDGAVVDTDDAETDHVAVCSWGG